MRVEIDPEVFHAAGPCKAQVQAIMRLMETFDTGRHDWVIDPFDVEAFAGFAPSHFPSLAQTYTSMAKLSAKREMAWTAGPPRDTVTVNTVTLEDLAADLSQSAVVVVEDLTSDGERFLGTLIEAFGAARLRHAYKQRWFEVAHSGGKNRMPAVAADVARRFRRLIRIVAFLDSDRLTLNGPGNNHQAEKLAEHCAYVHLLAWREAENYVPDAVLSRCVAASVAGETMRSLQKLMPHQRAVYDMKYGFLKIKDEQRDVFADLEETVQAALRHGFGRHVLATLFDLRAELTAADFEAVDSGAADELRALLDAIDRIV